jgi:hypothetical protein
MKVSLCSAGTLPLTISETTFAILSPAALALARVDEIWRGVLASEQRIETQQITAKT